MNQINKATEPSGRISSENFTLKLKFKLSLFQLQMKTPPERPQGSLLTLEIYYLQKKDHLPKLSIIISDLQPQKSKEQCV